jgi:hypothetical protein
MLPKDMNALHENRTGAASFAACAQDSAVLVPETVERLMAKNRITNFLQGDFPRQSRQARPLPGRNCPALDAVAHPIMRREFEASRSRR